jgi:hypothetical protein
MSEKKRKQIPGATMWFSDQEIKILIEVFGCKTVDELSRAARRYEDLFFMFDHESHGVEMYPGEDFRLVLALAEHCVFENFTRTDEQLEWRYREKPRRGPGRTRKQPLPENLGDKLKEARKLVSTNEDAAQRLKALGIVPEHARSLKPKTLLKYIKNAENEEQRRKEEELQRYLDAVEAFKDVVIDPPDDLK